MATEPSRNGIFEFVASSTIGDFQNVRLEAKRSFKMGAKHRNVVGKIAPTERAYLQAEYGFRRERS